MKKVIGTILLILAFASTYAIMSVIFYFEGYHWAVVAFAPLGIYVLAGLAIAFEDLIEWLLK